MLLQPSIEQSSNAFLSNTHIYLVWYATTYYSTFVLFCCSNRFVLFWWLL